jgi:transposase
MEEQETAIVEATIQRIWKKHKLQPHRIELFKFSNDPDFAAKVCDIVALYLNPPDRAIVLSVDEKSQTQALDRTQPILPSRPGLPGRQTYDHRRHGTTTLFAALNVSDGTVLSECRPRHRHQEFARFLERIDESVDTGQSIYMVLDYYGKHKHPIVKKWLLEHPRYHLHFTPTSSSWPNQVEHWFAESPASGYAVAASAVFALSLLLSAIMSMSTTRLRDIFSGSQTRAELSARSVSTRGRSSVIAKLELVHRAA